MSLQQQKNDWEELAAIDPLWAILSSPQRQYGRWAIDEFFASGEAEIAQVLRTAATLGYPRRWERALDFGCGVGRLTRALSGRFAECWGVDIAAGMVDRARQFHTDRSNCTFVVNDTPDLRQFESRTFDFVYSSIVLQHLPNTTLVRLYLEEFLRVLRPGGLVVFQLPYLIPRRNRLQLRRRLYALLHRFGVSDRLLYERAGLNPIRMIAMPIQEVLRTIAAVDGVIARTEPDREPTDPIRSFRYYVHLDQLGSSAEGMAARSLAAATGRSAGSANG